MEDSVQHARSTLVTANRILYQKGVIDGFGHVSCRHPERADQYLLSRNRAPGQVTEDDIITFDLDSRPVHPESRKLYLERFIHGEIYRLRPDVSSVVHNHSVAVITLAAAGVALQPVFHMAGFLARTSEFDIRKVTGQDTDLLIRDAALARQLADALGNCAIVSMTGHGATLVGDSIEEAVYRAIYAEVNASMQLDLLRLAAQPRYLSEGESDRITDVMRGQLIRCWRLWQAEVGAPVQLA